MEAFSLLKYWKATTDSPPHTPPSPAAGAPQNDTETTDDEEGPFIDLEFTLPDEEEPNDDSQDTPENPNEDENDDSSETEKEFKLTLSPSNNDDLNLSDDLFFKGELVQLEQDSSEPNSKPQFTTSLLKSATKFRVFMLGLKKLKSNVVVSDKESHTVAQKPEPQQKKLFTVKFKVEEVPIVSLFTTSKKGTTSQKQNPEESESPSSVSEEKQRFSKEVMQKYLKKVKPLYVKVSQRYAEKLRFSGQLNMPSPPAKAAEEMSQTEVEVSEKEGSKVKSEKQRTLPLPAGLRVVCKHLGKSRSSSSSPTAETVPSRRRDDSLVQQQDGIQSAILHCKKSFNTSKECDSSQLLPQSQCVSEDPLDELSPASWSKSSTNDEGL